MEPGEVYAADFPDVGRRPVIIVSRPELNRGGQVVVMLCTTARLEIRRALPNCVPFSAGEFGLAKDCVAQCEQILTLDEREVSLDGPVGRLDDERLRDVIRAIGHVMGAECEPE